MAAPESFEQKQVEELFGSPDTKPSESIPFDGALPGIPTDSEPDSDTISDGNALIEAMMGGQEDPIVQAQGPEKPTPFSSVIDDQPLPLASRPPIPDEEEKANLEANRNSRDGNVRTPSPMRPEAKEVTTGLELALVQSTAAPDWLPSGWSMEIKIRTSGVTAGTRDRYFYDPVSRRRFRSKKEVLSFLETGTVVKPKSKSKKENLDANVTPGSSSSVPHKRGGSNSKRKSSLKFDTVNRPEKVRWVLTGSAEDSFKPFVGEEELPDNCKQAWAAAYHTLINGVNKFEE
eukprot:TRINITY_DN5620_c0_g1_i2.p1 TRINITY_DN5620_c0_g1~~TRINITY_DN5620_c0_g1_i2.p1  ORF type:complete len:289 (-),score=30.19 TRINITY_DN5620_c0_g1_i2:218-1084(-)